MCCRKNDAYGQQINRTITALILSHNEQSATWLSGTDTVTLETFTGKISDSITINKALSQRVIIDIKHKSFQLECGNIVCLDNVVA